MTRIRRAFAIGLLGAALLAGSPVFSGAPALGFLLHPYLSQVKEVNGIPTYEPWGVAFDASGNLFANVPSNDALDVFDAASALTGQFHYPAGSESLSLAVNDTTGDVYAGSYERVYVLQPEGGGKYEILQERHVSGGETFVAVDNSSGPRGGDVYVIEENTIDVVKPNAAGALEEAGKELLPPPEGFSLHGAFSAAGLAIDRATGAVFVANPGHRVIDEYNNEDVYQRALKGPTGSFAPVAVAVEGSTGDIYAADGANKEVDELDASGKYVGGLAQPPAGPLTAPLGVAVNASGQLAVADAINGAIYMFGAAISVPYVSTGGVTAVERTGAQLEGVVNPEGEAVTSCQFEYGTSTAYGHTAACVPAPGSGSSPVPVSAEASGLAPGATYHYRLVASSAGGTDTGRDATFVTENVVSELQTEAATNVEQHGFGAAPDSATLHGSFAPDGSDTHYYFEYGETEAYGSVSPALPGADAGEAFTLEHLETSIAGLKSATRYHYRLVATNAFGALRSADATFATPAQVFAAPVLEGVPASGVSQFAATLHGTIQTGEAVVNYRFEYGTSTAYGSVAPIPDGYTPITAEPVQVSQPVSDLQAGTVYHYRIVASSPGATEVAGPDETFTTLPVPAPSVATGAASGVGVGAATLSGTIDPHGWDTSYSFQYGPSTAYGSSWPTVLVDMGALEGAQPVVVSVPNLLPGTTYHYRLVAANGGGTAYGPDMTFTTAAYPAAIVQEPPALRTLVVPSGEVAKPAPKRAKRHRKHAARRTAKRRRPRHPKKRAHK